MKNTRVSVSAFYNSLEADDWEHLNHHMATKFIPSSHFLHSYLDGSDLIRKLLSDEELSSNTLDHILETMRNHPTQNMFSVSVQNDFNIVHPPVSFC